MTYLLVSVYFGHCEWSLCLFLVSNYLGLHSPFHGPYDFRKEILDSIAPKVNIQSVDFLDVFRGVSNV